MQPPLTYSEPELVAGLKRREETAYSYLYDHYAAALFGVIQKVVAQPQSAEDILQEVFLKIYRNIGQYEASKGRLFTWMLHIARNTAIDTLRSKDFREQGKIRELDANVGKDAAAPSTISFVDHLGLDKVILSLKEEHRKVIDLAYFKGYTQEEIAKELEMPLGTVKTRIRNALIQLRNLLNVS